METWEQATSFVSKNLSRGGMFLAMPDAAPRGTLMHMIMLLPDGSEVTVRGEVRHAVSRERAEAEGKRAGVGIKFLGLDDESKTRIGKVVDAAQTLARGSQSLPIPVAEPVSEEDDGLLREVRAHLGEMKEQDYFAVLEIPNDASDEQLERGFLTQLQRWDPDKLAEKSPEIREAVAEIVILVQAAYAALSNPDYREGLRKRTAPEPVQIAKLFDDVPAHEPAPEAPPAVDLGVEADANHVRAVIVSARAARQDCDFEKASQILAKALAEVPGDRGLLLEYHLTMGYAEQTRNALERAARHFDEVIRINPQHRQAIAELRHMAQKPQKEKRALLRRLFHRNGD